MEKLSEAQIQREITELNDLGSRIELWGHPINTEWLFEPTEGQIARLRVFIEANEALSPQGYAEVEDAYYQAEQAKEVHQYLMNTADLSRLAKDLSDQPYEVRENCREFYNEFLLKAADVLGRRDADQLNPEIVLEVMQRQSTSSPKTAKETGFSIASGYLEGVGKFNPE